MASITHTDVLLAIILARRPIKARDIAKGLTALGGGEVSKTEVNSLIYRHLRGHVVQDEYYRWSLGSDTEQEFESEPDELPGTENTVNLDSLVKLKFENGDERQIGFTKGDDSSPFDDGVMYISRKKPLALSLLGKKVGDVCIPLSPKGAPLSKCIILEIS